jgi:hypothetical protein
VLCYFRYFKYRFGTLSFAQQSSLVLRGCRTSIGRWLSHGVTRPPAIVQSVLFQGKVFDKSDMMGSLKPTPKMRPKAASRPRPKTIHIDSGSVEMAEGMMQPSRGKKGSTSNLTANSTMKRDYYRGSQDSLADRSMSSGMLYRGVFLFYFVFIFLFVRGLFGNIGCYDWSGTVSFQNYMRSYKLYFLLHQRM